MSLQSTAQAMVSRGILAADESRSTIERNFTAAGIEGGPEEHRAWRELLFTCPGLARHVSGVILFDETTRQSTTDGRPFVELLCSAGIVPGVKVDRGTAPLPGSRLNDAPETMTEGLDGLPARLAAYAAAGLRFAKWRAVYRVGASAESVAVNSLRLALYARMCQDAGLVPIVEPEVLMDGSHALEEARKTTELALHGLFEALYRYGVLLEGAVLKPNMVMYGYPKKPSPAEVAVVMSHCAEVAEVTVATLARCVPVAIAGVAFLSGGQPDESAIDQLYRMNLDPHPWRLTYSYGRGLQSQALRAWAGDPARIQAAQEVFLRQADAVHAASLGRSLG